MIKGFDKFKEFFKGLEDQYILIGGAACDKWISDVGLTPRATKDLDIILVIESLNASFLGVFWEFVKAGKYKNKQKSTGERTFYRFYEPEEEDFPFQLELLSRKLDNFNLPEEAVLTPIPAGEDLSSLSAILLNEDYYDFVRKNIEISDGIPFASIPVLICLKAKAYLNLTEDRAKGNKVKSLDIKKHKSDVIRLLNILPGEKAIKIPEIITVDLKRYLVDIEKENQAYFENVGKSLVLPGKLSKDEMLEQLRNLIQ